MEYLPSPIKINKSGSLPKRTVKRLLFVTRLYLYFILKLFQNSLRVFCMHLYLCNDSSFT